MKDVTFHEKHAYFYENLPHGKNHCDDEKYFRLQEIRFIEFLEYHRPPGNLSVNEEQVTDHINQTIGYNVSEPNESKHYVKVYMSQNCIKTSVDSQETNLDDPSHEVISEKVSESDHSMLDEKNTTQQYIGHEQGTPHPIDRFMSYARVSNNFKYFISTIFDAIIPKNLVNIECDLKWKSVMQDEMIALVKNNTWDVRISEGAHLVGQRQIYTIKYKPDGTIEMYKAILLY